MARPRKDDDARRTEKIAFLVTPAERLQLEARAVAAGLDSAHEYARRQTLRGRVVVQQHRAIDPAVFDELRRIGVNLNQLARIANATGRLPARLQDVCLQLEHILVRELDGHLPARPPPPPPTPGGP